MFKIVAAVDKSGYASIVMDTVSTVAAHVESDITILTVVKPKRYRTVSSGVDDETTLADFHRDLIRTYFPSRTLALGAPSNREPKLISTQGATVHSKIVEGSPADVICSFAETINADLVVVGKRGERNVGALLLGSVSEEVVHKCARSVLVAKREGSEGASRQSGLFDVDHGHRRVQHDVA